MPTTLIVDSQRSSRRYLSSLLASFGHVTVQANEGFEALKIIETQNPRLIISDILMQSMDGYEFVEHLRQLLPSGPPVIFYVAKSYEQEALSESQACGVEHVLSKTSDPDHIIETVNATLHDGRSKRLLPKVHEEHLRLTPPLVPINPDATVYVVDDDPLMRQTLSRVMQSTNLKVQTFASAEEFLDEYEDEPGCLLLDLQMPGMSGIAMLEALRGRRMQIPAIVLTGRGELSDAKLAIRLRALDFLDKSVNRRTLLARVYFALQEDSNRRHEKELEQMTVNRLSSLTVRERELVKLLIAGRASKEIAAALHISLSTVATHRAHLMAKTGAANVADLVRMGMIAGD